MDLQARLADGQAIVSETLEAIDWQNGSFEAAVFTDCVFVNALFIGANFAGARFTRCRFQRCRFAHADLHEALFEDCVLVDRGEPPAGTAFASCDLRSARLRQCDLSFAAFDRCDLFCIDMEGCNLLGSRFSQVDFSHSYSRKLVKTQARFHRCQLGLADLSALRLNSCDLSASLLREADLGGTDLSGADLRDCDLFQAALDGAKLDNADLRGAEISGLNLLRLAGYRQMKINADQQHLLLGALGIDVDA